MFDDYEKLKSEISAITEQTYESVVVAVDSIWRVLGPYFESIRLILSKPQEIYLPARPHITTKCGNSQCGYKKKKEKSNGYS